MENFGKEIKDVLSEMGLYCVLQNIIENEIATKYEFSLKNIKDYSKLQKAIKIMSMCSHKDIKLAKSEKYHFAIEIKKEDKTLNALKYANNTIDKDTAILGIDNDGENIIFNLKKSIHTIIGGATGMGKTNILNNIIYSLTKSSNEEELQLYLIDIKKELGIWDKLPNVMNNTAKDCSQALDILEKVSKIMEKRFEQLSKNRKKDKFNQIVVVIDELADLMLSGLKTYIEEEIVHIAQIGRAVNIHLIIATQSPIAKVCTNLIKANCPTVIALKTVSIPTSRVILDNKNAFELQGVGDCIIRNADYPCEKRFKALYLDEQEILKYVKEKKNEYIQQKKKK